VDVHVEEANEEHEEYDNEYGLMLYCLSLAFEESWME